MLDSTNEAWIFAGLPFVTNKCHPTSSATRGETNFNAIIEFRGEKKVNNDISIISMMNIGTFPKQLLREEARVLPYKTDNCHDPAHTSSLLTWVVQQTHST